MLHTIIGIYDPNIGEYVRGVPYLYNGTSWEKVLPKVYSDGTWKDIGGAGEFFYKYLAKSTVGNGEGEWYNGVLIREKEYDRWIDKNGLPIHVKDTFASPGDPAEAQVVFEHT